jgi:hypothetical protein
MKYRNSLEYLLHQAPSSWPPEFTSVTYNVKLLHMRIKNSLEYLLHQGGILLVPTPHLLQRNITTYTRM